MKELIIHLTSNPAVGGHSTNNFIQSRFELQQELNTSEGNWFCSVQEFESEAKINHEAFLCCDFVDSSLVNGKPMRVLKSLKGTPRGRIYYPIETSIPVTAGRLRNIKLYICGSFDSKSYLNKNWTVTLKIYKTL